MRRIPERFRRRLREMVGADEEASRLAAAWALGLAMAFSPLIGLHWVIAFLIAHVFRLNKLDAIIGTLVINPWTLAVYFPAAVLLGTWMTGVRVPHIVLPHHGELLDPGYWRLQGAWLKPLLVTWVAGSAVIAAAVGVASFFAVRSLIEHHRRRRHTRPLQPPGTTS